MRKLFIGSLFAFVLAASAAAQQPQFNVSQYRGAFSKETVTVSSVSKALTAATYNPTVTDAQSSQTRADYAYLTVETDCIRYWPTGDAPTSSLGHKVCDGGSFYVYGYSNITNLRMIRITNDATVQVSYYRFITNQP